MIRSIFRRSAGIVGCAVLAIAGAACATTDDGGAGGARGSDAKGRVFDNAVKIVDIDRSTVTADGRVRYRVDNISGQDQEDLVWSVTFVFPRKSGESDIEVAEENETTAERPLVLVRGEQGRLIEAVCGAFAERQASRQEVIGTRLNVASNPAVFTVARDDKGSPGTRFAGNRIECVGQSSIWDDADSLTIEFENVSPSKVSDLEVQAVFTDTKVRTKWKAIPLLAPGKRGKATLDLRGLDLGGRDFLLKVRQQEV